MRVSKDEVLDLKTLLACIAVVLVIWVLAFHWRLRLSMAGEDALSQSLLLSKMLSDVHGRWADAVYYLNVLGGVKTNDVMGTPPLFQFCAWVGIDPVTTLNLAFVFAQIAYAFLGIRAAYDLAQSWRDDEISNRWLIRLGMIPLFAFAPALGTRLIHGHFFLAYGSLVLVAVMALILATRQKTVTRTLIVVCILVIVHAFSTSAHQTVLYGAIFGMPILVVLVRPFRGNHGATIVILVLSAAMALSAPKFVGMLDNAMGNDAARQLSGPSIIYSGKASTAFDWLSSVPWGKDIIPSGRPIGDFHEVNFGFGPLLLLLFLLPWRRAKGLVIALILSAGLAIAFSMNIPGVAASLARLIPAINSFRAPQRAILSFALALPVVTSAAILFYLDNERTGWRLRKTMMFTAAVLALTLAILSTGPVVRESILWGGTLVFLLLNARIRREGVAARLVIFGLLAGTLLAFQERLLAFADGKAILSASKSVGEYLLHEHPRLASSLERTAFGFANSDIAANSPALMDVSTLSGYWFPPRRFLLLATASLDVSYVPTMNYFYFLPPSKAFPVIHQLYNVTGFSEFINGIPVIDDAGPTAGAAWFSADVFRVRGTEDIVRALRMYTDLREPMHRRIWIVENDEAVQKAGVPAAVSPECAQSQVIAVNASAYLPAHARVRSSAACPLTFAMNYTSTLRARILNAPGRMLTLFPAYGALTGTIVPSGEWDIEIRAVPVRYWWSELAFYLGIAITVLVLFVPRLKPVP